MYSEPFDKSIRTKGILYAIFFCFLQILGGDLLSLTNIPFILKNLTFSVYLLLFILSILLLGQILVSSVKKFSSAHLEKFAIIGLITVGAIVICGIIIDQVGISNSNENDIDAALNVDTLNYIITAIAAVIFAPVTEELFFRFLVYRSIEKVNPILSHVCVALLFGFFHVWGYVLIDGEYIQLVNMLPYIAMSLGFSILYQKTKNIWYPIILHGIINFIAVVL